MPSTEEIKKAEEALDSYSIYANEAIGSFVCRHSECRCVVSSVKRLFKEHVRKAPHNVKAESFEELWKSAKLVSSCLFPEKHPLNELYWSGTKHSGFLPMINGLDLVKVKGCELCEGLFKSESTFIQHGKRKHPELKLGRREWKRMKFLIAQGMSRKRGKENFFLVAGETKSGSLAKAVQDYDPGYVDLRVSSKTLVTVCEREKSGFLRLTRADERLHDLGLTVDSAAQLVSEPNGYIREPLLQELYPLFETASVSIFEKAMETFREQGGWRSDLMIVGTSGSMGKTKAFRFIEKGERGEETRKRYARSARLLLLVACRAYLQREKYNRIPMDNQLCSKVRELLQCSKEDMCKLREKAYNAYAEVFFQSGNAMNSNLFASTVCACLCIGTGKDGENQYRLGIGVSPQIVGILYTASCCAIIEMFGGYHGLSGTNEEKEKRLYDARKRITKLMSYDARVGVNVFAEIRSICSYLRDEEQNPAVYTVCQRHDNCGIYKGKEFSISTLGKSVRDMQIDVRKRIFSHLLYGQKLPLSFESDCHSIHDDEGQLQDGYWFMTDVRNRNFVHRCQLWLANNVTGRVEGRKEQENQWMKKADEVHQLLLSLLHITGGGPGRGTEIASIMIRNRVHIRRGIFFGGDEAVVYPTHCKTNALRGEKMRSIFRFLDTETTFLLKSFFILIHPILVCLKERKETCSEMKDKLRNSLCQSMRGDRQVRDAIVCCFTKYGVPFSFLEYRHWQRGYIKSKSPISPLAQLLSLEEERSDDQEVMEMDDYQTATIEQAGHSVHTALYAYAPLRFGAARGSAGAEQWKKLQRHASHEWHRDLGIRRINSKTGCGTSTRNTKKKLIDDEEELAPRVQKYIRSCVNSAMTQIEEKICRSVSNAMNQDNRRSSGSSALRVEAESHNTDEPKLHPRDLEDNGYSAREALRLVLKNKDAEFREQLQERVMDAVASQKSDIALILRTGFGKTATVCGPILYEYGVTIWISPLKALLKETTDRLKLCGIQIRRVEEEGQWDMEMSLGNVVLISPESVEKMNLKGYADRLCKQGKLNRIVFDEAHIPFMSQGYRESMVTLRSLQDTGESVQRVLISATIPPAVLPNMAAACGVEMNGLEVFRGDPCRQNLALEVKFLRTGERNVLIRMTVANVMRCAMRERRENGDGSMRILIICLTIRQANDIHEALQRNKHDFLTVCKYNSGMTEEETIASIKNWELDRWGATVVMVATDGFSTGTDVPNIRQVIVAGGSRSLIDFWQGAGRGGRDGKRAEVIVLYHRAHMAGTMGDRDSVFGSRRAFGDFSEWAENKRDCRRKQIEEFLGVPEVYGTCLARNEIRSSGSVVLCDVCNNSKTISERNDPKPNTRTTSLATFKRIIQENEVIEAKRRRIECIRERNGELQWIRNFSRFLSHLCVWCLVENRSKQAKNESNERIQSDLKGARNCLSRGRGCFRLRDRCVRCHQKGHRANLCPNLETTRNRAGGACCVCFVKTVEGRSIHSSNEYGRKGVCPYGEITKFVLSCYSVSNIRVAMYSNFLEMCNKNAREVILWMVEDSQKNKASVFRVTKWAACFLKIGGIVESHH